MDAQRAKLQAYALAMDVELVGIGYTGRSMFEQRYSYPYAVVSMDESRSIVRFKRSSQGVESPESLRKSVQEYLSWLRTVIPIERRGEYGLIEDMRDAPMIGGPEIDRVLGEFVPQLHAGWRGVAVLVRTAVGRLQARRKSNENPQPGAVEVFDDEIEALAFVSSKSR